MAKSVVREIIIALLLCLAILLVLAVVLYSYIPNNKVIPETVSYTAPEDVKDILAQTDVDTSQVILTYEVNGSDLSTAQKTNNYNPGKVNPFSSYKTQEASNTTAGATNNAGASNNGNTASNAGNTTSGGTGSTNSTNSSTNEGTYYKDKGTK